MRLSLIVCCISSVALCGCSTVMEANRPQAVSIKSYKANDRRFDIISKLGAPLASTKDGDLSCDLYKLNTHGHTGAAKGAIVAGSAIADVFTLGLFEVVGTSAQAASKTKLHNVMFCYAPDERLSQIKDDGTTVDISGTGTEAIASPAAAPSTAQPAANGADVHVAPPKAP